MINISGNFGFLGLLTQVQTMPLLDDWFYHYLFPGLIPKPQEIEVSWLTCIIAWAVVLPYLLISFVPLWSTFRGQIPWMDEILGFFKSIRFQPATSVSTWTDKVLSSPFVENYYMRFWEYLESWDEWLSPFRFLRLEIV